MPATVTPGYDFVHDKAANWLRMLARYVGVPTRMLEIGSFEGGSAVWWIENILTHPQSTLRCVDPWINSADRERAFDANIAATGQSHRVTKIKCPSHRILHIFPDTSLDIVYVDGNHEGVYVMTDALLSLQLLKIGGVLILDDYEWTGHLISGNKMWGGRVLPKVAIDAFLTLAAWYIEVLDRGYQIAVQRVR